MLHGSAAPVPIYALRPTGMSNGAGLDRLSCDGPFGRSQRETEEVPMQYMLMVYGDEARFQSMTQQQVGEAVAAYGAYTQALRDAGILLASDRLRPASTATTVRVSNGKTQVLNGPYAETKEQLGGFFIVDVPDLDAALSWAARCPGASNGSMEVRPIWTM
jgi:hypothetical protein